MEDYSWALIESDPGVFTELIESLGVKGVQVEECWECSEEELQRHKPVYGIIFLFKYGGETKGIQIPQPKYVGDVPNLFFANQVINNACATQAILSILMNIKDTNSVDLGPMLTEFKKNVADLPSKIKGVAIGNHEEIRKVHNNFHRTESITVTKEALHSEDIYHFISYVPFEGHLYELDGLKSVPIDWGEVTEEDWLAKVIQIIKTRISRYQEGEIHFSLMAAVGNKKQLYEAEIKKLKQLKSEILSTCPADSESKLAEIECEISNYEEQILNQQSMFQSWRAENARRRHDYIPFLYNLLKILAEKDKLLPLIDRAKMSAEKKSAKS
ncbi:uncharacterized protein LOC126316442 [Schistocerca gregaria]|uniref:uncharacterized protein LOC126316442 n=1 Tax=Schistocerca gregaria TaxID=7010 RepID=UPI00211E2E7B|nr:uncharacterized protein LOC126316442 [Schistocerca gregaria]